MTRKILITGASSEIGAAISRRVLKPGDEALLHYSTKPDACERLAESLPCSCEPIKADFLNDAEVDALCLRAGQCDILINAAASVADGLLVKFTDEQLENTLRVNVHTLVKITRAAVFGMMMRRHGIIVNISSLVASRSNRGSSVYAGTKGFMEAFSRSVAVEYGPRGVRINCVAPGAIDAGSFRSIMVDAGKKVIESIALRKTGKANDVAAAVEFLCSDDAAFITGAVIPVDGGFLSGL